MSKIYLVYKENPFNFDVSELPQFACDDKNTAKECVALLNGYTMEMEITNDLDEVIKIEALKKLTAEEKRVLGV